MTDHPLFARLPVIEVMDDTVADVLRQKTEIERLKLGLNMWKTARVILRAAIRSEQPTWDEDHVDREIAKRISHGVVNYETE